MSLVLQLGVRLVQNHMYLLLELLGALELIPQRNFVAVMQSVLVPAVAPAPLVQIRQN